VFKALWPKRASSNASSASTHVEADRTGTNAMVSMLSHTSAYHLERLEKLIDLRFEKTFGDLDDDSLRNLIAFASRVQDADIQRELLLFYLNCPPSIQSSLRHSDIVSEDHVLRRAPDAWS